MSLELVLSNCLTLGFYILIFCYSFFIVYFLIAVHDFILSIEHLIESQILMKQATPSVMLMALFDNLEVVELKLNELKEKNIVLRMKSSILKSLIRRKSFSTTDENDQIEFLYV